MFKMMDTYTFDKERYNEKQGSSVVGGASTYQ